MSEDLAQLLAGLRRDNKQQSGLAPALVPSNQAAAYETADNVAASLGWPVGGWKIAATNARMQKSLRTDAPIRGRVFEQFITDSPAEITGRVLLHPVIEPEFVVRLGSDLPPRDTAYTREDVAAAVAAIHPGIEVAECRFVHDEKFPPLNAILADGSGSGSIVIGKAIPDWPTQNFATTDIELSVNGTPKRHGNVGDAIQHPLVPLTWLANALTKAGIGLQAGQIVSTGTLTGMILARPGDAFTADFGPFGSVQVSV